MISTLTGRVESVEASSAVIEVHGVGYEVRMAAADLAALHAGQETHVFTSLTISQDAVTLFGFLSPASKRMFLQLQKVSGIGPKVALSLLSTLPPDRLAKAVADGDTAALSKAPGLGKKGAQKIRTTDLQIPKKDKTAAEVVRTFEASIRKFNALCDAYISLQDALKKKAQKQPLKYSEYNEIFRTVKEKREALNEELHELDIIYTDYSYDENEDPYTFLN